MKKTSSMLVFGAFVGACMAAVQCGGSDSNSTPTTTTGTAGTTAGNGAGGANNGGANNGGTNNGGANNGGANNGGSGNPTDAGGAGTMMGGGGTVQIGGDSGTCPAKTPMNNDACTGNEVCVYPTQNPSRDDRCSCVGGQGPRADGGGRSRGFVCFPVNAPRDAGAMPGADAGGVDRCANGTNAGETCDTAGTVCRIGNNGFCDCVTVGNRTEWFCN